MSGLVVAAGLFCVGLYGILTRRDIIGLLASIEVMMGGALVLLVKLGMSGDGARIEAMALVILVAAAAEAAVGLALLVVVAQRAATTRIDEISEVRG